MNEEILKLVEESFLQKKEKTFLMDLIKKEGTTSNFFKEFENLLVEEVKKISGEYKNAIEDLNSGFFQIDEWFDGQKNEISDEAEKKINNVDVSDITKKKEIWDEYDRKLSIATEEYKKRLGQHINKLMIFKIK